MTTAYPLAWPQGLGRSKNKVRSQFRTGLTGALQNVEDQLRRFGVDTEKLVADVTISSNCSLGSMRPADPGVAVYFRWDGIDCCIAVDRYPAPEDNLQAISLIIEAERTKLRHGGLNIVRQAMRGYAALPPPKGPDGQLAPPWWHVLGFEKQEDVTLPVAESEYRKLVKAAHPDAGGDPVKFNQITEAIRQARQELGQC